MHYKFREPTSYFFFYCFTSDTFLREELDSWGGYPEKCLLVGIESNVMSKGSAIYCPADKNVEFSVAKKNIHMYIHTYIEKQNK